MYIVVKMVDNNWESVKVSKGFEGNGCGGWVDVMVIL